MPADVEKRLRLILAILGDDEDVACVRVRDHVHFLEPVPGDVERRDDRVVVTGLEPWDQRREARVDVLDLEAEHLAEGLGELDVEADEVVSLERFVGRELDVRTEGQLPVRNQVVGRCDLCLGRCLAGGCIAGTVGLVVIAAADGENDQGQDRRSNGEPQDFLVGTSSLRSHLTSPCLTYARPKWRSAPAEPEP
jgi:hypothetical protein